MRLHQIWLFPPSTVCQYYPRQLWSLISVIYPLATPEDINNSLCISCHDNTSVMGCNTVITLFQALWSELKIHSHNMSVMTTSPENIQGQGLCHAKMAVLCITWPQGQSKVTVLSFSFVVMDKTRDCLMHYIQSPSATKHYRCLVQKFQLPLHLLIHY